MRWGLVLVAAVLAGCASDPPALVAGEPTYSDADVPAGPPLAPLRWAVLAEGSAALSPATPAQGSVTIPNGTLSAFVNLTPMAGAARGLAVTLGECDWHRDVVLVGPGGELAADCGGVLDSAAALTVSVDAGALDATWKVVVLTCDPREGICPGRLPVGS